MEKNWKWPSVVLKRIAKLGQYRPYLPSILDVIGLVLIAIGVFAFSIPLGFITSGIAVLIISWQMTKNGEPDGETNEPYQRNF